MHRIAGCRGRTDACVSSRTCHRRSSAGGSPGTVMKRCITYLTPVSDHLSTNQTLAHSMDGTHTHCRFGLWSGLGSISTPINAALLCFVFHIINVCCRACTASCMAQAMLSTRAASMSSDRSVLQTWERAGRGQGGGRGEGVKARHARRAVGVVVVLCVLGGSIYKGGVVGAEQEH